MAGRRAQLGVDLTRKAKKPCSGSRLANAGCAGPQALGSLGFYCLDNGGDLNSVTHRNAMVIFFFFAIF